MSTVGLGAVHRHTESEFPNTWLTVRVEVFTLRGVGVGGRADGRACLGLLLLLSWRALLRTSSPT